MVSTLKELALEAKKIDQRIYQICIIVDDKPNSEPFFVFHGSSGFKHDGVYGLDKIIESVKPHDPVREKQEAITKLKEEIKALEEQIEQKEAGGAA